MVDHTTGQVFDHIDASTHAIVKWTFTYNQGVAIGASLAMLHATGNTTYFHNAALAAAFLVSDLTISDARVASGRVLYDGPSCSDPTCAQFKGIAFR